MKPICPADVYFERGIDSDVDECSVPALVLVQVVRLHSEHLPGHCQSHSLNLQGELVLNRSMVLLFC